MSRLGAPEQIIVRPTNNVYTALVVIALVVVLVGVIILYMRHDTLFSKALFGLE